MKKTQEEVERGGQVDAGARMDSVNIYHERQIREMCALHALNNLFQGFSLFHIAKI